MALTLIGSNIVVDRSCHPVRRVVWSLSLLAGLVLTLYQIQTRVSHYFRYPTMVRLDVVEADALPFPEITLCNLNPVNNTWLEVNNVTDQFRDYQAAWDKIRYAPWLLTEDDWKVSNPLYNLSLLEATKKVEGVYIFRGPDTDFQMYSTLKKNVQVFSSLLGKSLPLTPFYHDLAQSVCYALNGDSSAPLHASSTTASGIISFSILYNPYWYMPGAVRSNPSRGYDMRIITPGEAEVSTTSSPIYLEPGYSSVVSLTYKEYLMAPPPHGDCDVTVTSRSACVHERILSDLYDVESGCSAANRGEPTWRDPCPDPRTSYAAFNKYNDRVSNNTWNQLHRHRCEKPCKVSTYQYTVSSKLLDSSFFGFAGTDPNVTGPANLIVFSAFFTSTSYERYAEIEAYNAWALLCDVGGALGLFLGATLLTLLEMADAVMAKYLNISFSKKIVPKKMNI